MTNEETFAEAERLHELHVAIASERHHPIENPAAWTDWLARVVAAGEESLAHAKKHGRRSALELVKERAGR